MHFLSRSHHKPGKTGAPKTDLKLPLERETLKRVLVDESTGYKARIWKHAWFKALKGIGSGGEDGKKEGRGIIWIPGGKEEKGE